MAHLSDDLILTIELHSTRPETEALLRTMLADSLAITTWRLDGTTLTVSLHAEEGQEHLARAFSAMGLHPVSTRAYHALDSGDTSAC